MSPLYNLIKSFMVCPSFRLCIFFLYEHSLASAGGNPVAVSGAQLTGMSIAVTDASGDLLPTTSVKCVLQRGPVVGGGWFSLCFLF